jgi:cyclic pyranopterin phosphate synthase
VVVRDSFGRTITYLRVSVTSRCNLQCWYCPAEDEVPLPPGGILTFEEITAVVRTAAAMGFTKVRLTGGEPLVRREITELVRMLRPIEGIDDLAMTTNGILLAEYAARLAAAGLDRVNVSLDAVKPERYAELTGGGDVARVLAGIDAAMKAGLEPVKLNCVVRESSSEPDAQDVARYGAERGLTVRFIRVMDPTAGAFSVVEGGAGGDCPRCDRLRLSCTGEVRPCLLSDLGFDIRTMGPEAALRAAVLYKPEAGSICTINWIRAAGG